MPALTIRDDMGSEEPARRGDRQTLRDWVHRYNAEAVGGLCNLAPGRRPKLSEGQMAAKKTVVLAGPDPVVDKISRWRIVDLCGWLDVHPATIQ